MFYLHLFSIVVKCELSLIVSLFIGVGINVLGSRSLETAESIDFEVAGCTKTISNPSLFTDSLHCKKSNFA